ncbi:MAG: ABC transporter substrate-binding protein [Candidatus Nanopelagicaceae bacterium]
MKNKKLRVAIVGSLSILLAASTVTPPANAAKNGTVILHEPNPLSGFNSAVVGFNLVTNSTIGYLTGMGFGYYDSSRTWVQNTTFGSYKVTSNKATDFRVQYTVAPGRVWSDGTPITGIDLLSTHMIYSRDYAKAAGLGDWAAGDKMAFNAAGLSSSTYSLYQTGDPVVSADEMSVTFRYKQKFPDWWLSVIGARPVHAWTLAAEGKTDLQSVSANEAARDRWYAAYKAKDSDLLKKIGTIWSTSYNNPDVNAATTNPLLWVGNGGFNVVSAVKGQSVTLKANPLYNSGPKVSGDIKNIIQKFVADGNPVVQALGNGEVSLYSGQQTADGVAALKKLDGVTTVGGLGGAYEHVDLRSGAYFSGGTPYTGLFAGNGQKATDLRRAFLLCVPRQEIVEKLITPINAEIPPLRSVTVPSHEDAKYAKVIAANGSSYYVGTQNSLNRRALSLVQKYQKNAVKNPLKVNFLVPGNNARRAAQALLLKANLAKCGFDVNLDTQVDWSPKLRDSKYDATFFAWAATSTAQGSIRANWRSDGSNNYSGSNSGPGLDAILDDVFGRPMSNSVLTTAFIKIEREIFGKAYTLPLYQHPSVTAYDNDLKGVKASSLSPVKEWNFWDWKY